MGIYVYNFNIYNIGGGMFILLLICVQIMLFSL